MQRKKSSANRSALHEPSGNAEPFPSGHRSKIACSAVCAYWILFGIPFPWDISLLFLAGISLWIAVSRPGNRSSHRYWELIILFVAALILSMPAAPDIARSIQFSRVLLPSLLVFYLTSEKMEPEQLLWLANCIVVASLLLGLLLLWVSWRGLGGGPAEWVKATGITFLHVPNDVVMLVILGPISLASSLRHPSSVMGVSGAIGLMVSAAVAVVYQSRLSVLSLALALGVAGTFMLGRKSLLIGGLALLILLLTVDILSDAALLAKFSSTWNTRLPLWMASWCMFLKAPLFGNGPGSFLPGHRECLAELVQGGLQQLEDSRIAPWAHSLYLEVLAEHGVAGLFSLIILLAYGIVSAYRIPSPLDDAMRLLNSSVLAALIAFCAAAAFELSLWRQWVTVLLFTLMGIVAGINRIYQANRGAS